MSDRAHHRLLCLILGAAVCGAPAVQADSASERHFIWNEANAAMMAAHAPEDFLRAAADYQKLVDLGVRNAPLFYNLGTALLGAGQYADAVSVLLRAERYGGSQPDIDRNLLVAIARRDQLKEPALPWYRFALFWHYRLPFATRALLAAAAFSGIWLALSLRRIGAQRGGRLLLVAALTLFVVFGSSVATSLQQEVNARRPLLSVPAAPTVGPERPAP